MRSRLFLCLPALLLPAVAFAADEEPKPIAVVELSRKEPVTYAKDIEPILNAKCSTCHSATQDGRQARHEQLRNAHEGRQPRQADRARQASAEQPARQAVRPHRQADHAAQQRDAAVAGGAGPHQAVDRPGRQGAERPAHERPKVVVARRRPASSRCAASPSAPTSRPWPPRAATRSTSTMPAPARYVRSLIDPDLKTPDGKAVKAAHLSLVESLAYSPDGKYIASGSLPGGDPLGRANGQGPQEARRLCRARGGAGLLPRRQAAGDRRRRARRRTAR